MPQVFSHLYSNTTNVYGRARSRRDYKDTKYLGEFQTVEVPPPQTKNCFFAQNLRCISIIEGSLTVVHKTRLMPRVWKQACEEAFRNYSGANALW